MPEDITKLSGVSVRIANAMASCHPSQHFLRGDIASREIVGALASELAAVHIHGL